MAHHNLDSLDKKILKLIAEDARIPFLEVARSCNVSGAAIHQRIQKLNNLGVLKGSKFIIDPEKIGYETCAYMGLNLKNPEKFDEVVDELKKIPEVVECHYTTGDYDMFHPLAHTLLIRLCISLYGMLGSFEKCAAVYSVLSMLMMAGCFSLLCASISRSFGRTAARVSTAFFCLYPAHMAFASNCTKDGLFSAFFALFLALAVERIVRGGMARRHTALMVIAGMMACLFRNNMIYAMAVWAAVLLCIKGNMRRLGALALACCALGYGVNQGMGALLDAGGGNIVEMLSVPIQQLARARVLAPETFDEGEAAKNRLEESDVRANMGALADAYMSVGRKRPDIYLDAFLNLALPSIYPYSEYRVAQPYIEVGIQPGGVLTGPFGQAPLTQPGRFEAVREALKTLIYDTGADHVPLVRWLFNCGAIFWLLLALWLRMAYRGNLAAFGALLLAVLLWATFLLGPVMQGRYLYPFICALPLFSCCACDHTRQKTKEAL